LWKSVISPIFSILCLLIALAFLNNSFNRFYGITSSAKSIFIKNPYGIVYLHPYNISDSWFLTELGIYKRTSLWQKNITVLKPQIEQDLQLIKQTGYKWVVIFPRCNLNVSQVCENVEWFSNKTHEYGLELIVVCCGGWSYYNTSTPEYQNILWALGNISQFEYVKYVSSYSSTDNATEWWVWYQTLDSSIKAKYIPHVDAPYLNNYKIIYSLGFDSEKYVLLEAYTEEKAIECSYFKKAYVLIGQWRGSATPSDQIKGIENKIGICEKYRQFETFYGVWCFDDTEQLAEDGDYGIYFPYEPYLLIPSHIVEVS